MGTPTGEVIVRIYVQENGEWIPYLTLTTDEYGHAEAYLPRGFYMIVIEKEGYKPVRKYVRFLKDTKLIVNLPITIQLPPQKIAIPFSPEIGISDELIYKPKVPLPLITSSFSTFISTISFANILRLPLQIPLFSVISNPSRPIPQSFISFSLDSRIVRNMQTPKPSASFSIISNPSRPAPQTLISFSASVGVRKSP